MRNHVYVLSVLVLAASLAAPAVLEAQSYQGLRPSSGLPGPKSGGAATQPAGGAATQPAGGATAQPAGGASPVFDEEVLEMTPATLDRFAKALAEYEAARKEIAAKAARPVPKPTKSKQEYQECQMKLMMTPEFQQLMQESVGAMSAKSNDPKAAGKAAAEMQAKMEAFMMKACGPDPNKTYTKPDVGSELRGAQSDAARSNSLTDRQYAILRERITPLCFSDPVTPGPDGVKIKGEGPVFFVYTASEVAALQPRCEAFTKALYPKKR
jgi:hypothetical protein